jgi:hypothetical protein
VGKPSNAGEMLTDLQTLPEGMDELNERNSALTEQRHVQGVQLGNETISATKQATHTRKQTK